MLRKRPSLLTNAVSNWTALFVAVTVGFFLTPFIIDHLGKTVFGIWKVIASIIGYYGLIDIGCSQAITRYIAKYTEQKDYRAFNETISTALAISAVLGLFFLALSFVLADPLAQFFNVPANQAEEFRYTVWLLGLIVGIELIASTLGAVIRAHELFVIANCVAIFGNLLRAGLIVYNLSHGIGFIGIAYANLANMSILALLFFILCKRFFPYFQPRFCEIKRSALRVLFTYSFMASVMGVVEFLRLEIGSFFIAKFIGFSTLALYAVPLILIQYFNILINSCTVKLFIPRFTALEAGGKPKELRWLFLKNLFFTAALSFFVGTLIIILGKKFIVIWVGSDFVEAVPVLCILAICFSFKLSSGIGEAAMYALNRFRFLAIAGVAEVICNIILCILLVSHYGMIGVAIGVCVPMLITSVLVYPVYIAQTLNISLMNYWGCLIFPLILSSGIVAFYGFIPKFNFLGDGYFSLALYGAPILIIFGLLGIIFYTIFLRLESSSERSI